PEPDRLRPHSGPEKAGPLRLPLCHRFSAAPLLEDGRVFQARFRFQNAAGRHGVGAGRRRDAADGRLAVFLAVLALARDLVGGAGVGRLMVSGAGGGVVAGLGGVAVAGRPFVAVLGGLGPVRGIAAAVGLAGRPVAGRLGGGGGAGFGHVAAVGRLLGISLGGGRIAIFGTDLGHRVGNGVGRGTGVGHGAVVLVRGREGL